MSLKIRCFTLVFLLLGSLGIAGQLAAAPDPARGDKQLPAVSAAASWLITTHQNDDGGYTSFSTGANTQPSDVPGTLDAILALASAGYDLRVPYPGKETTPVTYLNDNSDDLFNYAQTDGSTAGKTVLALLAAQQDPRAFGGVDYVATLSSTLADDGAYNVTTPYQQALAILGGSAAGEEIPDGALQWLLDRQATDEGVAGSWDDGFGTTGNADATAMSLMAFIAAGVPVDDTAIAAAREFLAATQTESGGWEYGPGFGPNVNSTGLVIQALQTLGEDFADTNGPWSQTGITPLDYLLSSQSTTGAFQTDFGSGPSDDFFATVQALPALAGRGWPLPDRVLAVQAALSCLQTLQDPATSGWENFAGFGVDAGGTARAIQAIAAAGEDPTSERWTVNGVNAVQALENLTPDYLATGRGGRVGTVMQAVAATNGNVNAFAGLDLYLTLTAHYSETGALDDTSFGTFGHSRAMLGAIAAGYEQADLALAIEFLQSMNTENGWGDPDSNGLALQVLGAFNLVQPEMLMPIRASQLPDGGWGFDVSNPNSTSEVSRGLMAAGENPFSPSWSVVISGTITSPADVVLAAQGDNGCWPNLFGPGDDPFATTDAIMLLAAQPQAWGAAASAPVVSETTEDRATPEPVATEAPEAYVAAAPEQPVPTAEPTAYVADVAESAPTATSSTDRTNPERPTPTSVGAETTNTTAETEGSSIGVFIAALGLVVVGLGGFLLLRRRG